jgi:hypothetical protein
MAGAPAGTACIRTTGHTATIPKDGYPKAEGFTGLENDPGKPVVDGENGATVTCKVSGSSVSGRMNFNHVSFGLTGGKVPATENGTANLSSFDPIGLSMASPSGTPCSVTALKIQSGAVWATFRCAQYQDPTSPQQSACAAEGVFLFQNCEE